MMMEKIEMDRLSLDKLAEQSDLDINAIRFYEQLGLLINSTEWDSLQKLYSQEEVSRLRFIKRAQKLGFSLNDIKELLHLKSDSQARKEDIKKRTRVKIRDVENKLFDLYRIKGALEHIASECDGNTACRCEIIEALDPNTEERLGWRQEHIEY
jgi:DNA-binding transcriptional MerR regulator